MMFHYDLSVIYVVILNFQTSMPCQLDLENKE